MATRAHSRGVEVLVVACLLLGCGPGSEAPLGDSMKDLGTIRRLSQFVEWTDAPHALMRRLRTGWPSLEQLDEIVARGKDAYASDEGSRLAAAFGVLFRVPIVTREELDEVLTSAAKEKWSEYETLGAQVRGLTVKAGTRLWADEVDALTRAARERIRLVQVRRSVVVRGILADYMYDDDQIGLVEKVLRHDE